MDVQIVNFPETKVAVLAHSGSQALEHESVRSSLHGVLKIVYHPTGIAIMGCIQRSAYNATRRIPSGFLHIGRA
jgi:hypothetical protein